MELVNEIIKAIEITLQSLGLELSKQISLSDIVTLFTAGISIVASFFIIPWMFIYKYITFPKIERESFIKWLKEEDRLKRYIYTIKKLSIGFDNNFGRPSSLRSFSLNLSIAIVYPFLFFLISYSFFQGENSFSSLIFPSIPPEERLMLPVIIFTSVITLISSFYIYDWLTNNGIYRIIYFNTIIIRKNKYNRIIYILSAIMVTTALSLSIFGSFILSVFLGLFIAWLEYLFSIFSAIFTIFILLLALLLYVAIFLTILYYFQENQTLIFFAMLLVLSLNFFIFSLRERSNIEYFIIGYIVAMITVSAIDMIDKENYQRALFIIIFSLILPFINAFFDWLSLRITRLFINKIANEKTTLKVIWSIFFDIFLAIIIIISTAITLPAIIEAINYIYRQFNHTVIIDWHQYAWDALTDPWGKGLMITIMLISPIIPTLIHILSGLFPVLSNSSSRDKLANYLSDIKEGSVLKPFIAATCIEVYLFFVITVIILTTYLMYKLLNLEIGALLFNIVDFIYIIPPL